MFSKIHWVENLDKKSASSSSYWRVLIKNEGGSLETLLFTDAELLRCRERARKNPEDLIIPTLWDKIKSFIAF